MNMESATVALGDIAEIGKDGKRYTYYGLDYMLPVDQIAALCDVSLRTMKDVLKLHSLGYTAHMAAGWTMKQCFADAGVKRTRKPAPTRAHVKEMMAVIINYREQMADAVDEIKRLRDLVFDLGVDPDAI